MPTARRSPEREALPRALLTMADAFTKSKRSEIMRSVRTRQTEPERAMQAALKARGVRFRLHDSSLPGTPDIVLIRRRAVIQVRGCFWHGHACSRGRRPASNVAYWKAHVAVNRRRDARCDRALRRRGWHVFTAWTCRLSRRGTAAAVARIMRSLDCLNPVNRVLQQRENTRSGRRSYDLALPRARVAGAAVGGGAGRIPTSSAAHDARSRSGSPGRATVVRNAHETCSRKGLSIDATRS